jgi:hypothetical protein
MAGIWSISVPEKIGRNIAENVLQGMRVYEGVDRGHGMT